MTRHRSSVLNLLGRAGDLIVAALARKWMPEYPMEKRSRLADSIERRIGTLKEHEHKRLLTLVSEWLANSPPASQESVSGVLDFRMKSYALVDRLVYQALDPHELDLVARFGRIHLTMDWDERRRGRAPIHFIMVRLKSARSTIAHARMHGLLHRIGKADVALTADEWRWLYSFDAVHAVRGAGKKLW